MKRLLSVLMLLAATSAGAAIDVEGVKFADREKIGASDAVLNGAGMRNKLFIKAYAVGLYLPEKRTAAAEALTVKGAKRLRIVALRDLTAEQFADALVKGVEHNTADADMAPLRARLDELKTALLSVKEARKGSTILLDWLPDSGTRLVFEGKAVGKDIPGEDLYQGILRIWLGDHPVQDNLKPALLGQPQ